jgi:serine/threonine protein kinase/Tfp pilus assembly protein PilF
LASALERLVQGHSSQGDYEAAIPHARRRLALDPLHEPAHRQLIELYAHSGQQAAALRQYQECVRILEEELGVLPAPETTQLNEAIKAKRFPPAAEAQPTPSEQPAADSSLFPAAGDQPGVVKLGRYELLEEIGRGGFAIVYRGRDTLLERMVALKLLRASLLTDTGWIVRFQREAKFIARLDHPRIVTIHDIYEVGGRLAIVMRLVEGLGLDKRLVGGSGLPWPEVVEIINAVAEGLDYAHAHDILHRDLKPANILLDRERGPLLSDFGLARLVGESSTHQEVAGTPHYIAPEIWDSQPATPQADIYALGCILFEMVTGQKLFPGETPPAVMMAHFKPPQLPTRWPDGVPGGIEAIISRAVAPQPADRYPTAGELAQALAALVEVKPETGTVENKISQAQIVNRKSEIVNRHNLPPQPTPFIGRETELAALDNLIADSKVRLITIVGPGGMGKTRLALASAERQLYQPPSASRSPHREEDRTASPLVGGIEGGLFPNGVYFVNLAPLSEAEHIIPALAAALNFPLQGADRSPQQQILDYLRQKQMLLVMDNFEHLLGPPTSPPQEGGTQGGVDLVANILQAAPQVKILATSRERLHLHEEQVYPIQGLEFPAWETPEDAAEYTAVKLFLHSARRVRPNFALTSGDLTSLTRICRLVEGMPLGVELAAAWVDILPLADIAAEIQQSLDFLETDVRNIPERHRSMRAVFDASWQRLSDSEQEIFAQLSVFRGGFTRPAAQEVTGASLKLLATLANKSLIRYSRRRERYEIHELLRQYGAEKLQTSFAQSGFVTHDTGRRPAGSKWIEGGQDARDHHSAYYLAFLQQQEQHLKGPKLKESLVAIKADIDNIRLAWQRALEQERWAELKGAMEALYIFYDIQGWLLEGNETFADLAARLRPQADQTEVAMTLGLALAYQSFSQGRLGPREQANALGQESVVILRPLEPVARRELAWALYLLGEVVYYFLGESGVAHNYVQESLALFKAVGDAWGSGTVLVMLGLFAAEGDGAYPEAEQLLQESLAIFTAIGEQQASIYALSTLGRVARRRGQYQQAEEIFRECFKRRRDLGDQGGLVHTLHDLGEVARLQGAETQAEAYYNQCLSLAREIGQNFRVAWALWGLSSLAERRGDYLAAKQLFEEGQAAFPLEYSYPVLGWALLGLKDYQAAKQTFYRVLKANRDFPVSLLQALTGLAQVWAGTEKHERSLELLALVLSHPASDQEIKDRAGPLQTRLAAELPPEVVEAAQTRGRALDLRGTVAVLLDEFAKVVD